MSTKTEEVAKAEAELASASREISKQLTGKQGNAAEIRYGETYQRLVKLGAKPKIKAKHSQPKRYR